MKKKILTLIGGLAFIALMAVNLQANENSNALSNMNLNILAQDANAGCEPPSYPFPGDL